MQDPRKGLINGASKVFKANSSSDDYHNEMNFENFTKLLEQRQGWSGGAMVLGKLPVPGHPTYLE